MTSKLKSKRVKQITAALLGEPSYVGMDFTLRNGWLINMGWATGMQCRIVSFRIDKVHRFWIKRNSLAKKPFYFKFTDKKQERTRWLCWDDNCLKSLV